MAHEGQVEFFVRVKLPHPYELAPRGREDDPIFQAAQDRRRENSDAIFRVKPQGYEVKWPYTQEAIWPVDAEGYSWVRLAVGNTKDALSNWQELYFELDRRHHRLKEAIKNLPT